MSKLIFIPLCLLAVSLIACSGLPTGTENEPVKGEAKKAAVSSDAPKITYSKETTVNAAEPVELDCEVKNVDLSGLKDFRILWSKLQETEDGEARPMQISSNTDLVLFSDKYEILHPENSYRYSLKIAETSEEDTGTYRCSVVFGAEQKVDADVPLIVLKAAYFSDNTIKTVQVTEGDAISIDCQPGGSPKPDVVWQRVGQELPYYGGQYFKANRFDLPLIDRSHNGHYMCHADNGLGDPVTSEVFLEVHYKPIVNISKESISASAYDEVKVECSTDGIPHPTVHWEKNGELLQSTANILINEQKNKQNGIIVTTLVILKLQLEDFSDYDCIAENSLGIVKKTVRIELKTPPNIEKQTVGEKIYQVTEYGRGRSKLPVALECEGSGVPAPRYRWFKDGSVLPWEADSRMSLEPGTGTLLIQNPTIDDNGVYICSAFNELGTAVSDEITLTNETAMEFIHEGTESGEVDYEAELGRPFHFSCPKAVAHPKPYLTWMTSRNKDEGIEMSPIDDERMVVDEDGTLWVSHVTEADDTYKNNFKFSCLASSELHPYDISLAKTVSIRVVNPPEGRVDLEGDHINIEPFMMHSSPDKVTFTSNRENQIECIFGGEPSPGVIWERQDEKKITADRFYEKNHGQTLVFRDTQPEDAGKYTCLASNIVGPIKRKTIEVEVEVSPKFRSDFKAQAQIVHDGATVTFACDILGGNVATPKYEWFFNGRPLEIAEASRRKLEGSNLIISSTNIADTGNYACKASNEIGYAYGQTTLNVIPRDTGTKSTSIADSQVLQDIQKKVETLSSDVQTLKNIVETQVQQTKVHQSMAELLSQIAQKVLKEDGSIPIETTQQPSLEAGVE